MELLLGVILIATAISTLVLVFGVMLAIFRTRRARKTRLSPGSAPPIE